MKIRGLKKKKSGAASFYIVAFSTLILTIVAVGFAAVIISEITRSANDDLAQSAFDSALAGVEDAKLALYNYQNCIESGKTASQPDSEEDITCGEIIYYIEQSDGSNEDGSNEACDMVSHALGRIGKNDSGEVIVEEHNEAGNNMEQAYTCVQIKTSLTDYRGSLSSDNPSRVVKVKLDGVNTKDIEKVKVSWYANDGVMDLKFNNFSSGDNKGVMFGASSSLAVPPTLSVQMIQTGSSFAIESFDLVENGENGRTNRGTVMLVPTNDEEGAKGTKVDNYVGAYDGGTGENVISAAQLVKSNDKTVKNLPYAVYCDPDAGGDFVCSTYLNLPLPVGDGVRNDDTFMFVVSIPYGEPDTDFALEFFCKEGTEGCGLIAEEAEETGEGENNRQARLKGMQIGIDSTGRANNLYRRVETRLDTLDSGFPFPLYALQLLGEKSEDSLLKKNLVVTSEYNFRD